MMNKNVCGMIYTHYSMMCHKGFHEKPLNLIKAINLMSSEVGEAIKADRVGNWAIIATKDIDLESYSKPEDFERLIKDTVEDEFADIMLRLWDLIGCYGIDEKLISLTVYDNRIFPVFKYDQFQEILYGINREILDLARIEHGSLTQRIEGLSRLWVYIETGADLLKIDLEYYIKAKMAYNKTRELRHGKKY